MGWIVASEDRVTIQARGIIPGRLVAPPPDHGPAGIAHAVDPDAAHVTVCGHPTGRLYLPEDPIDWTAGYIGIDRCTDCRAATG